ncbi:Sterile alpha and TIR motif-containing protein 1, partial [Xenoophorus captivus]
LARSVSGILEHMFKHTAETSVHLISNGALDALLFWCRGTDPTVLRHCAVALANCAMYGGHRCQRWMIEKQAAEWLFPLAFSKEDELIRFHACLAVTVLAANREIEKEVVKSGTLELVEPFIASLDPDDFALQSLKRIVMYSSNGTACSLAKRALSMMGEEVPKQILSCVPNWKTCEVQTWLQQVGFSAYSDRFQVDGDLLLNVTDQDLSSDLSMAAGLTRKRQVAKTPAQHKTEVTCPWSERDSCCVSSSRFLRDLRVLKTYADYSTCDPDNMADWLAEVDPRFRQYTYGLVQSGVDRNNVENLTDQQLQLDCHIDNGVHRAKILSATRRPLKPCHTDAQPPGPDVFISYRRTTGSQLARYDLTGN